MISQAAMVCSSHWDMFSFLLHGDSVGHVCGNFFSPMLGCYELMFISTNKWY
jgi:hypothetical protein